MDPQPLRILLVEDAEDDALVLAEHLRRQGLAGELRRVEDLAGLAAALAEPGWDLLLADFHLPSTDGLAVLREAGRIAPELPCILLSGRIDEAAAVGALRAGAKDFVAKSNLARLVPAIQREVAEARERAHGRALQADLDRAEGQLGAIVAAALDGIVVLDGQRRICFWNAAAERIFGYRADEALGRELHLLLVPERFQRMFLAALDRLAAAETVPGKVLECHARRRDGDEFPLELALAPFGPDQPGQVVGILRDITARRQLELQQLESLQLQQTLVETIPSPLYYQDPDGRILGGNLALQEFFGLSRDRLEGRRIADFLPADIAELSTALDRHLLDHPGVQEFAARLEAGAGAARQVIFRRCAYAHADGAAAGIVGIIQDVTELKEAEAALRQTEALFTTIHSHLVDLVAIIDATGRRIYTSPSYRTVLGYEAAEMANTGAADLLHPDDRERVELALRSLQLGRPTQNLGYRLRHKDGRWLHFESTAALIPATSGGAVQALVVARDVTARKEDEVRRAAMEIQLRQAQKLEAIGQLAAGIAHEINTPTQYIGDNATFLRDCFGETFAVVERLQAALGAIRELGGAAGEAAARALAEAADADLGYLQEEIPKAVQQSLEGVARIAKIVGAMKDFSHPGGESKTATDLHRAIESTITVSRNVWKYCAELETDFDPALPPVPCFPGEFNQVVLNLIVNAAHAIEAARADQEGDGLGHILVRTRRHPAEVEIAVSDDGTGIPEAIRSRIFEPFFTTKAVGQGTGQGLAIVHAAIVEKHGGRLALESEPGRGSTFRVFLPLEAADG